MRTPLPTNYQIDLTLTSEKDTGQITQGIGLFHAIQLQDGEHVQRFLTVLLREHRVGIDV